MLNRRSFLRRSFSWPLTASLIDPLFIVRVRNQAEGPHDETLTKVSPTGVESLAQAIVMKSDNLFFVARRDGSVPMTENHGLGLYYHDCRYVNGYELMVAGQPPVPLS